MGLSAVLGAAAPAEAATYYVRKTGSDANDGWSPSTALLTLSQAASKASAGDTVYVGAGTYPELVTISRSGTPESYISYIADTSGDQTGDAGDVIVTGSSARDIVFYSKGYSFIRLEGFCVTAAKKKGVHFEAGDGITIQGCRVYQNGEEGMYFKGACSYVVTDCRSYSNGKSGIYIEDKGSAGGSTVSRCIFSGNSEWGVKSMSDAAGPTVITNCMVYGNASGGIEANGHGGHNIFNNTLAGNTNKGLDIKATGSATVKNCIFAFNSGVGLNADGTCTNSYNLVWLNGGGDYHGVSPGPNDIVTDPLFRDRANSDYHLTTGSPARNAGTVTDAPTKDYENNTRRAADGFVDIGADEYVRRLCISSWRCIER